jgi:hypothetical protein
LIVAIVCAFSALFVMGLCSPSAFALEWYRANQATISWDGPEAMPGSTFQYRIFKRSISGQVAEAGVTAETFYTLTLADGQRFFVEVQVERVVDGVVEAVSERRAASDNPADCLDGKDFGLKRFDPPGQAKNLRNETVP